MWHIMSLFKSEYLPVAKKYKMFSNEYILNISINDKYDMIYIFF